jgi:hypothetical protein
MNSANTDSFIIRGNHALALGGAHRWGQESGMVDVVDVVALDEIVRRDAGRVVAADVHSGGNDGIEVTAGSFNVTVRNNVIHDTIIGNHYPCIFVYGGGAGLNIVEGNVMWNCGEGA